jgi:hypothetical protein
VVDVKKFDVFISASEPVPVDARLEMEGDGIYKQLRTVPLVKTYRAGDEGIEIGLRVVQEEIDHCLEAMGKKPDFLFLETSLLPEATSFDRKIADFLLVRPNALRGEGRSGDGGLSAEVETFINGVRASYLTLHQLGSAPYSCPELFLEAKTMTAAMSTLDTNEPSCFVPSGSRREGVNALLTRAEDGRRDNLKRAFKPTSKWDDGILQASFPIDRTELAEQTERPTKLKMPIGDLEFSLSLLHYLLNLGLPRVCKRSFLFALPLLAAHSTDNSGPDADSLTGLGAVFMLLGYDREIVIQPAEAQAVSKLVTYIMKDLYGGYLYATSQTMFGTARQQSIRSAVGAIMARNMSHLLGSHVEPGKLNDIGSFLVEIAKSGVVDVPKDVDVDDLTHADIVEDASTAYMEEVRSFYVYLLKASNSSQERYSVYLQGSSLFSMGGVGRIPACRQSGKSS